jgi:crotonobetainyl-CoA:carnitine CoA-transferase CaiB-like acyl-CoA transferase
VPVNRPLAGIRVLDLTRVLAGPVATRFLAGFGAEVLRIDPPSWEESALAPEMTLGKRCAHLDFRKPSELERLKKLIAQADVLVHGYRPGALPGVGLDSSNRRGLNMGLVDVCLSAYGWSGPWKERRGFDSLVQMSGGIADAGMRRLHRDRPTPLPVQALDHATGYLMAAAVLRGLTERRLTGRGSATRTSLARTAWLLLHHPASAQNVAFAPETEADLAPAVEATAWGLARRLLPPLILADAAMVWDRPAGPLGAEGHQPVWG